MTNANVNKGFVPTRMIDGSPYAPQVIEMVVLAANSTALFVGDMVVADTFSATGNPNYLPCVKQAAAGTSTPVMGVVESIEPYELLTVGNENPYITYRQASVLRKLRVIADRRVVFVCNSNATLTGAELATQSGNFDIVVNAGSTANGMSGMALDVSTHATTSTLPLKCVGWHKRIGVDPTIANVEAEVILNSVYTATFVSD